MIEFKIIAEYGGSFRVDEYWDGRYQQSWGHYHFVSDCVKDIRDLIKEPVFNEAEEVLISHS